ncbi:MAG TPA: MFS transporter [Acidimicrobiales bacterium]|nr:MFS transporter [Acidimicrobiales bacterium]
MVPPDPPPSSQPDFESVPESDAPAADDTVTEPIEVVETERDPDMKGPSLLGSRSFFRLWMAQVVSSLGDWTGLVAVLAIAARVGGSSPEAAIGIVMSARLIPGFFLASVGGVLVDRLDRKKVMVYCDIGRGLVMASLPFVESVAGLFVASLFLEILTLLWSPAKEATVPNLVSARKLTTANSLSLAAAYGTFPLGSALFASLTKVAEFLGDNAGFLDFLTLNQESLAIYADVLTFFTSAFLISTLTIPRRRAAEAQEPVAEPEVDRSTGRGMEPARAFSRTIEEVKEGWQFIRTSPVVRSVMVGLGTGLIGGGMVAPLGPTFSTRVLHAGPAGFGLLLTALGMGVAIGVVGLSTVQRRLPHHVIFPLAVIGAGACMMVAVSMSSLGPTMLFITGMGICAGAVYVLGFTILQESVDDDLRGRIFATLYTLSRLCLLVSLTLAPLVAGALDGISESIFGGSISIGGLTVGLPGVRLTLWLGASIILVAGVLALRSLRAVRDEKSSGDAQSTRLPGSEPA